MDWLLDYSRLSVEPGAIELPGWKALRVSGPDARELLHGQLSSDVKSLAPFTGQPSCLLTAKGMLQADFALYDLGSEGLAAVGVAAGIDNLKAALAKLLPLTMSSFEEMPGPVCWTAGAAALVPWRVFRDPAGLWVLSDPRLREDAAYYLGGAPAGAAVLDRQVWEALRVEAGVPLYGVDADASCLPLEAGLDAAVSFDKGCYLGQEVMSRIHHMGHVNRHLRRLRVEGEAAAGPLYDGSREVGRATSVSWSPREGAMLALGLVREECVAGMRLELGFAGLSVPAVVL